MRRIRVTQKQKENIGNTLKFLITAGQGVESAGLSLKSSEQALKNTKKTLQDTSQTLKEVNRQGVVLNVALVGVSTYLLTKIFGVNNG